MSAQFEISELDKTLAEDGEDIILRRVVGSSLATQQFINVTCRAFVRGYSPDELVGGLTQQDSKVILSPTQINEAQWPGGQVPSTAQFPSDPRVPTKNRGDRCIILAAGKNTSVESSKGVYYKDGTLIRIDMTIRG